MPESEKKVALGGFASWFVKDAPSGLPDAKVTLVRPVTVAKKALSTPPSTPLVVTGSVAAQENDPAYKVLRNAVFGKATPYREFLKRFEALVKSIPDETTRFCAAVDVVLSDGADPRQLLASFDIYEAALAAETESFEKVVQEELKAGVGTKAAECTSVDATVAHHRSQIEKLEGEIRELEQRKARIQVEVAAVEARIGTAKQGFYAAKTAIEQTLRSERERFAQHLKGGG